MVMSSEITKAEGNGGRPRGLTVMGSEGITPKSG